MALYHRLRDLFSLQPDLVLFDITSTYFEGAGPEDFAKHGYSRDGKSQNVQVVVGMVMVAGWPIAHHVWAGNRLDVDHGAGSGSRSANAFCVSRGWCSWAIAAWSARTTWRRLQRDGHGYLVGMKRRRNAELDGWLQKMDETKWLDCPVGITAREKKRARHARACKRSRRVTKERRVFVIDSDERRSYEQAKRSRRWSERASSWPACSGAWRTAS